MIADFLETIPDRTASTGMRAVGGLAGMHRFSVRGALPYRRSLAQLPGNISGLMRRAARLLMAALSKMQAAIGADERNEVRKQASDWLAELGSEADVRATLGGPALPDRADPGRDRSAHVRGNRVARRGPLSTISVRNWRRSLTRHATTVNVTTWVLRALAVAEGPLLAVTPWGPLAIGAGYAGTLGYTVYIGGDYLDWYRLGDTRWLDRVKDCGPRCARN